MDSRLEKLSEIRVIVAHGVGLSSADMADDVDLLTTFAADWNDLLRIINMIEETYHVTISAEELGETPTIQLIYGIVARQAGWPA